MQYRLATEEDWPAVQELMDLGGLEDVQVGKLGGSILVAENSTGKMGACIWAMTCGEHAYLDYLVVHPSLQKSGLGVRLLIVMLRELHAAGVRVLRGHVHEEHAEMLKIYDKIGADISPGYCVIRGTLDGN